MATSWTSDRACIFDRCSSLKIDGPRGLNQSSEIVLISIVDRKEL